MIGWFDPPDFIRDITAKSETKESVHSIENSGLLMNNPRMTNSLEITKSEKEIYVGRYPETNI
jgi:hypothetical protein